MKVLLIKDVYKVGRAGDVKKVADGYGRNFLLPQGLAVLATAGALKQAENIRVQADIARSVLNDEMSGVAEKLANVVLTFPAKAGETGKLYGSITPQMIADAIQSKVGIEINRRNMDFEPIRTLGEHKINIRLTMDLVPEIVVIVHREGEKLVTPKPEAEVAQPEVELPVEVETEAAEAEVELEAETAEAVAELPVEAESEIEPEAEPEAEVEAESAAEVESEPAGEEE